MVHAILLCALLVAFIGQKNRFAFPAAMAFLGVLSAVRYGFSTDYYNYLRWYNNIHAPGAKLGPSEFFYNLLNYIAPSYQFVVIIVTLLFVFCIWKLVENNLPQKYHWVGLFIFLINPYLFLMNLSAMRQCLAMILFILAIRYASLKKPLLYFLLLIPAIFFHKSAIILFPFYFILNEKPFRRRTVLFVLLGVFSLLFIFDLNQIVNGIALWFKDANYLYYSIDSNQNSLRATLLTSLYFFYTLANLNKLEGKTLIYGKLYLIGTILGVLAFRLSLFTRLQMYFDIFSIITLPMIFHQVSVGSRVKITPDNPIATIWGCINKYLFPLILVFVYFLRYYSFFTNPMWESFTHYQTIFSMM